MLLQLCFGYKVRYDEDPAFQHHFFFLIRAFAFLPADMVMQPFLEMEHELPDTILGYFEPEGWNRCFR